MSQTSPPVCREWDKRWKDLLLCRECDEQKFLALWKLYSQPEELSRLRGPARWLHFLTVTFGGRELADISVSGMYWRSGLFFRLLRLLTWQTEKDLSASLNLSLERYHSLASGELRPTEAELDHVLEYLRSRKEFVTFEEVVHGFGRLDSGIDGRPETAGHQHEPGLATQSPEKDFTPAATQSGG